MLYRQRTIEVGSMLHEFKLSKNVASQIMDDVHTGEKVSERQRKHRPKKKPQDKKESTDRAVKDRMSKYDRPMKV